MAYIQRDRHGESDRRQVFCDASCWVHYAPFNCACPERGTLHATADYTPCPELTRMNIPPSLVGAVRCAACGQAVT